MHQSVKNIIDLYDNVKQKIESLNYSNYSPQIIAVSKTFSMENILPLINYGHLHFGENKVQEALSKWSEVKVEKKNIKLHMIGKLQSNKVKQAVSIFDYIHSVDSIKLANKICEEQNKQNKNIKIFLQVNIGDEIQKSGSKIRDPDELVEVCKKNNLNVIGLMCLPPANSNSHDYFILLKKAAEQLNLKDLSMGMSSDFENALILGSTYIRLGTAIMGERNIIQ